MMIKNKIKKKADKLTEKDSSVVPASEAEKAAAEAKNIKINKIIENSQYLNKLFSKNKITNKDNKSFKILIKKYNDSSDQKKLKEH